MLHQEFVVFRGRIKGIVFLVAVSRPRKPQSSKKIYIICCWSEVASKALSFALFRLHDALICPGAPGAFAMEGIYSELGHLSFGWEAELFPSTPGFMGTPVCFGYCISLYFFRQLAGGDRLSLRFYPFIFLSQLWPGVNAYGRLCYFGRLGFFSQHTWYPCIFVGQVGWQPGPCVWWEI